MKHTHLIEKYFTSSLTKTEEKLLQELLSSNDSFAEEFNFQRDVQKAIASNRHHALKAKLEGYERDFPYEAQHTWKRRYWPAIAIAASVILLFGLGWILGLMNTTDYGALYKERFSPYPNTFFSITRSDSDDTLERKAFVAYETKDYERAITLFEDLTIEKNTSYHKFYLSQSYLGANRTEEAVSILEELLSESQELKAESLWYLGLAYIRIKDKERAKGYLQQLCELGTYKKKEAQLLVKLLD
ncbi:MAG: tetratricopeptide repeat protein [Bacteroidota bacterium]